jgi:hypothetical protein
MRGESKGVGGSSREGWTTARENVREYQR